MFGVINALHYFVAIILHALVFKNELIHSLLSFVGLAGAVLDQLVELNDEIVDFSNNVSLQAMNRFLLLASSCRNLAIIKLDRGVILRWLIDLLAAVASD